MTERTVKVWTVHRVEWCDECPSDSLLVVDVLTERGVASLTKCPRCEGDEP